MMIVTFFQLRCTINIISKSLTRRRGDAKSAKEKRKSDYSRAWHSALPPIRYIWCV